LEVELDVVSGPKVVDVPTDVDAELDVVDRPRVELEPTPVDVEPLDTLVDPPLAIVVKSAVVAGSCR